MSTVMNVHMTNREKIVGDDGYPMTGRTMNLVSKIHYYLFRNGNKCPGSWRSNSFGFLERKLTI